MARGWESKSVESQQEDALRQRQRGPAPTPAELARSERLRTLELTRTRLTRDLERASAQAHRAMLEQALAAVQVEITALGDIR